MEMGRRGGVGDRWEELIISSTTKESRQKNDEWLLGLKTSEETGTQLRPSQAESSQVKWHCPLELAAKSGFHSTNARPKN
jgi:hypothetical protein